MLANGAYIQLSVRISGGRSSQEGAHFSTYLLPQSGVESGCDSGHSQALLKPGSRSGPLNEAARNHRAPAVNARFAKREHCPDDDLAGDRNASICKHKKVKKIPGPRSWHPAASSSRAVASRREQLPKMLVFAR